MEQVSRQRMTTGSSFAGRAEAWGFCPKTSVTGTYASALVVALTCMAIPVALFLAEASIVSSTMLLVYLVCAIGLLSSVGAYIVVSLIRAMTLERGHEWANTETKAHYEVPASKTIVTVDIGLDRTG